MDSTKYVLDDEDIEELQKKFPYCVQLNAIKWDDIQAALATLGVQLAGHEFRGLEVEARPSIPMKEFEQLYSDARSLKDYSKMIKQEIVLKHEEDLTEFKDFQDSDSKHSVSKAEQRGFINWINKGLGNDPDLSSMLPIDPLSDEELYERCTNGILLCKLVNATNPDTIDERSINKGASLKHIFSINENLTLGINSAAAVGCCVVNIGPEDIAAKKKHIVLGLIWQLIRKGLVDSITLTSHSELMGILEEDETAEDLMQQKPEDLLMRWVNHQLEQANVPQRMTNYNTDIADSTIYAHLLEQIVPKEKRLLLKRADEILESEDKMARAADIIANAEKIGASGFLSPEDIYQADGKDKGSRDKLNLAFLATLFNLYPALEKQVDTPIDLSDETLEERTYKNWINSFGVKPYVSILDVGVKDGIVLLQLIDIIKPSTVDWAAVTLEYDPKKRLYQEMENCNLVKPNAQKINIKFVNVDGEDIYKRNKKLIMGVCFQLMHAYNYKLLRQAAGKSGDGQGDDNDLLRWANDLLAKAKSKQITSFRDEAFSTGVPILEILEQIRPKSTNREVWTTGGSDAMSTCSYAISCCRKAGARIYALPEHLKDPNGKMIQTTLVILQALQYSMKRAAGQTL